MNISYPRANLQLLESRIKYLNTQSTNNINNKLDNDNTNHQSKHVKKVFKLNAKTKDYIKRTSNLKEFNNNLYKRSINTKKAHQIKIIKSKYFHNELLRKNVISPLRREYQLLVSNLPNNKRCFKNLHNKDFDSIFKNPNNSVKDNSLTKNISKKNYIKDIKNKKGLYNSQEIKDNFFPTTRIIHYKFSKNLASYYSKSMIVDDKHKNILNYSPKKYQHSIDSICERKPKVKLVDKKKKYIKLISLIKKSSDKNIHLLMDYKNEEIKNKDSFLSSLVRYNNYYKMKSRKKKFNKFFN